LNDASPYAELTGALPVTDDDAALWKVLMHVDGECQCGRIAYEAKVDPQLSSVCNCTDCQKFSGSPWRASVPAKVEDFLLLRGTLKTYVKTADNGNRRLQAFCGDCGSPVYATSAENQTIFNLRLGALKQSADLPAKRQIWTESALPWAHDISGLPGVPKG
jgi:hypothetical protein